MSTSFDLARRAVACTAVAKASGLPKWRWMPGMRDGWGARVLGIGPGELVDVTGPRLHGLVLSSHLDAPDLDDHATLGCVVLGLLPDAWGTDPYEIEYYATREGQPRCKITIPRFLDDDEPLEFVGETLAEAAVFALEAAP